MKKRTDRNKQLYEKVENTIRNTTVKNDDVFVEKGDAINMVLNNDTPKENKQTKVQANDNKKVTLILVIIILAIVIITAGILLWKK